MTVVGSATLAERLARFAARASFDDLSAAAGEQLKIRVLDALGCAIGALGGEPVRLVRAQQRDGLAPERAERATQRVQHADLELLARRLGQVIVRSSHHELCHLFHVCHGFLSFTPIHAKPSCHSPTRNRAPSCERGGW